MLNSLKTKLLIISALILTVPLITVGIFSYHKSAKSLDDLGVLNLTNSVEMTIEMIEALNVEVENGNLSLDDAQERVKRAILGEQNADGTRPINPNIDLGENGYLFIISGDGLQLAHPSLEGENIWEVEDPKGMKMAQEVIKAGQAGGGLTYFDWPLPGTEDVIEPKVSYSKEDPYWGWIVVSSTYMQDFNQPAESLKSLIMILTVIALLIGGVIVWLFANYLSKPIQIVTAHMKGLAEGDLTQESIQVRSKDETGQLALAMNHLQSQLEKIMTNLATDSAEITNQSNALTRSASEVTLATEQVAETMQELAKGSEVQAGHATGLSEEMGAFTEKVQEANENGEYIQEASKKVITMTNEGVTLMENSTEQMTRIDRIVHEAVEKVEGLDVHAQEISQLVAVIRDIADQTNLLALNAAIEAARAGENGQGFAVVADEVRKLAVESSNSVTNITDIVARIQSESSLVSESLQDSYQEVAQGTEQIMTTGETFKEITIAVSDMAERIHQISDNLQEISTNTIEMNHHIQEVAAISEEAAAGVEETSAATEQTNASMQEVAASSKDLAHLAEGLNELVNQFELSRKS